MPYTTLIVMVAERLLQDAGLYWDIFYQNHAANFFKDRHYLDREFPELLGKRAAVILEVLHWV